MGTTDTMRWMGRSARNRAQAVSHAVKDRALERRLDRVHDEADRLRFENERLREELDHNRGESNRILDLLERRLTEQPEIEVEVEGKKRHRGRWLMFLMALGGGAYALVKMRSQGNGHRDEWSGMGDTPTVTQSGTASL